jgi:imidazole glycerol-phosphate synthase subunit HisF
MMGKNTNLKKRVIPVILVHNMQVVKSRGFSDYRVVGNLEQTIEVFNRRKVDEIIILDIGASKENTGVNLNILKLISRNTMMPLAYGGGVSSLDDIEKCLKSGCDKVVINNNALSDIGFLKRSMLNFGAQAIVSSIDYKKVEGEYKIYNHSNGSLGGIKFVDYLTEVVSAGVGEVILTSVDNDGRLSGYDLDILDDIFKINTPILLNGGCGLPSHIKDAFNSHISGACAGSIFYFTEYSYSDIKRYLSDLNVRS